MNRWPSGTAPSGVTSPVATDPLEFMGAVTIDKDTTIVGTLTIDKDITIARNPNAIRNLTFDVVTGTDAWRMSDRNGASYYNGMAGGNGYRTRIGSYYGIELLGNSNNQIGLPNTATGSEPGVIAINTLPGTKAFIVRGAASQSANLFEAQDSSTGLLFSVSSAGAVSTSGQILSNSHIVAGNGTNNGRFLTNQIRGIQLALNNSGASYGQLGQNATDDQWLLGYGASTTGVVATPVIGWATGPKLGFYGVAPVAQAAHPVTLADVITVLTNLGLTA